MGIAFTVFKTSKKYSCRERLHIVARCLDIWSWTRCKVLVGMLLGPQDLLILRDDIILQISSLFVAVDRKESLFFVDKKLPKDLFENLKLKNSAIDAKIYLKYLWLWLGPWCIFYHFWLWMVCHCFLIIDTRDLISIQMFIISLMFSLENSVKYVSFTHMMSVDKRLL